MTDVLQLQMPADHPRVESGVVQFGDDWPGVFIRGDNALFFAIALDTALRRSNLSAVDSVTAAQLVGLRDELRACSAGETGWPPRGCGDSA